MESVGRAIVRHRVPVLVLTLGLGLGLGAELFPLEDVHYDFSVRRIFDTSPDRVELLRRFKEDFGDDVGWTGVLYATRRPGEPGGVLTEPVLRSMDRVQAWFASRPEMVPGEAFSVLDAADLHAEVIQGSVLRHALEASPADPAALEAAAAALRDHELYRGRLLSPSGDAALVMGRFDRDHQEETDRREALEALDALLDTERALLGEGILIDPLGLPVVGRDLTQVAQEDTLVFTPVVIGLIAALLLLFFRSLPVTAVTLGTVLLLMVAGVGLMQALGEPINLINNTIPTILLVVGVAEAVHLVERVHGMRRAGMPPRQAAAEGTAVMVAPCLLTMVTTAVGFGSLCTAHMPILRSYGLYTAATVLLAALFNLTLLPALLSFGRKRPRHTRESPALQAFLRGLAEFTLRHPRAIVWSCIAAMAAAAAWAVLGLEINSRVMEETPPDNPVRQALERVEERLSGVLTHEVVIRGPEGSMKDHRLVAALDRLDRKLMEDPAFRGYLHRVETLADPVREVGRGFRHGVDARGLPQSGPVLADLLLMLESGAEDELARLVTFGYDATRISLVVGDGGSRAWAGLHARVEELLDEQIREDPVLGARFEALSTGTMTYVDQALQFIIRDMVSSVLMAFVIIMVMMALLFRSLRAGLISMLPNVFPLLGTAALMAGLGIPLRLSTLIIFAICLGIAVDDTIHFLARFRQEIRAGRAAEDAIRVTMTTSGRAMVMTTVLLVLGFLVNVGSGFLARQQFGVLAGATLVLALVGDLVLLPPLVLLTRLDRVFRGSNPSPGGTP
ncbi:MAG: MMPL family transporter [Deltaproteobacteria bacterium]|nr:MMPL family transporter [Deltaproteobacteria bacterium]